MKPLIAMLAAVLITLGLASTASAAPTSTRSSITTPVALPPGDTIELRTGAGAAIGAVFGGLIGLPFAIVGAIPGAIIGGLTGAGIGAASWNIANAYS